MIADNGFMARSYRIGALVWLAAAVLLAVFGHWHALAGWTSGCAISMALTRANEAVVARSFVPGTPSGRKNLHRLYILKLPAVAIAVSVTIALAGCSAGVVIGMLCGVGLMQISVIAETIRCWAAARCGSHS